MGEIFAYDFMIRALLAGLLAGLICPAVGVFLVLRRYAFMADTLAHISLAGVALGLILGIFPPVATLAVALTAALAVERLRAAGRLHGEAILALMMSSGLALAVVLISLARGFNVDVMGYLFGSILTVGPADLLLILVVGVVVLGMLAVFHKELFFISFDEECARVAGLPVDRLNVLFILLVALTVSVSIRVVGVLLVGALMVIPVLTAQLVAGSFKRLFWFSLVLGVTVSFWGLVLSYRLGTAAGGSIVLLAAAVFALVQAGTALRRARRRRLAAAAAGKVPLAVLGERGSGS
ncbi:iron chelate uptake ABC transporter family permease subunit [Desulfofundulus thermobenzoicus]|uniref:Iron chelate uptake ABC transporter family permease subunit n=1 Tax=Desulfofundulus thermobenzoicus TaxID=29376 RepID=A0A6N7ISR4_9FIRM|nr:metal ABC transporter permease [Desulfofundulus thermobenzoicus]MQL53114.1 iron chelate uptake ABC transporter family permease subunit [Desulfofundulus thermobenzoicus]HHW43887.1 metal ABC transporter permease [Desulfotomaculum sp.]